MPSLRYRVAFPAPHNHRFQVSLEASGLPDPVEVTLPAWTPGSYLIREFAKNVSDVRAWRGRVEKIAKDRWRVSGSGGEVSLTWSVYAHDLSVRGAHLDGSHAYFNGATLFLLPDGARAWPVELRIAKPAAWRVHTSLARAGEDFAAQDYDELCDAPVEVNAAAPVEFSVRGVPHELVTWGGPPGNLDAAAFATDLAAIVEAEARIFGGLPYDRYLFLVHLADKRGGGLEHKASTTLNVGRFDFAPRKKYDDTLALAAHELFHAWNVKRIKPAAFTPYDYGREQYTTLLWVMEGVTSYYDTLVLRRAGLLSEQAFLREVAQWVTELWRTPGRRAQSLAESSFDAWIKFYRRGEESPNAEVSYYLKGSVVAMLLDLELRQTGASLDDVMQRAYQRYGATGLGMPEDGLERLASEIAGRDLTAFFDRTVRSTEELDLAAAFAAFGLKLRSRPAEGLEDLGGEPPKKDSGDKPVLSPAEGPAAPAAWLGTRIKGQGGRALVESVLAGSPAQEGGIYPGDELIAVDGARADERTWLQRVEERKPGERVTVHVFRRDALVEVAVTLAPKPEDTAWIERDPGAPAEAKARGDSWLGEQA